MDKRIFSVINRITGRQHLMDFIMIFVSKRIRYFYFIVLFILWFKSNSSQIVAKKAIISAVITLSIRKMVNLFYFRPRPFVSNRVGILIPSKTDSTFLSKHTLLAFAISTSILLRRNFLGRILIGFSSLTGLSRIWVGHHYPSDIIRSVIVGGATSLLVDNLHIED
jgi:undecaprenyl-diphosphatase